MDRKGFTLIELMTVTAIIGILASIAIIKTGQSRDKAILATMQVDLKALVTAQEGFAADNKDYAGSAGPVEKAGTKGKGTVAFVATAGNTLKLTYKGTGGWNATLKNARIAGKVKTCGVYIGLSKYSPNKNVVKEGVPTCY